MRALLLLLLLSACGPIVQVGRPAPPPPALFVLTPPPGTAVAAGVEPVDPARAISVLAFNAPSMLATVRLPVMTDATSVTYLKDAQWAEPPARLIGRLIEQRLAGVGVAVIDRRVTGRAAASVLGGTLRAFQVDVGSGAPRVVVRLDATLAGPGGTRLRSFEREVPLARVDGTEAARAFNQAANLVAGDLVAWVAAG